MLPEYLRERERRLLSLVEPLFPFHGDGGGPQDAWPLVAHGLLAHASRAYRSVNMLQASGLDVDAARLTRSLYDHVNTLAWLAVDPAERLARWRINDLQQRLKAHNDAANLGVDLLEGRTLSDALAAKEQDGAIPDLLTRAREADQHWHAELDVLDGPGGLRSFVGLYVVIVRNYSSYVHATFAGLNAVTEDLSGVRRRVHFWDSFVAGDGPAGIASAVFGLGLYVVSAVVGDPAGSEIEAAFAATAHP